jgi:hypothetical protein
MRAIEFKSKIRNNKIQIPEKIRSEFLTNKGKDIRVIVFIDDSEIYDSLIFQDSAIEKFLKGYSESDSIYDNN